MLTMYAIGIAVYWALLLAVVRRKGPEEA